MLAYHWAQAGDAARALRSSSPPRSVPTRALPTASVPTSTTKRSGCRCPTAPTRTGARPPPPALAAVTSPGGRRLSASVPSWQLAQWHYEVGRSEWSLGRLQKTTEELQRAMELLGRPNVAISDQREASVSGFLHLMASARRGSLGAASWQRRVVLLDETTLYAFDALPSSTRWAPTPSGRAPTPSSSPKRAREIFCCASATKRSLRAADAADEAQWTAALTDAIAGGGESRRRRRRRADDGGDGDGRAWRGSSRRNHGSTAATSGGGLCSTAPGSRTSESLRARAAHRDRPLHPGRAAEADPPHRALPKGRLEQRGGAAAAGSASGARAHVHRFALETDARSYTLAADTEAELETWVQQLTLAFAAANAAAAPAADAAAGGRRSLKVEGDDAPRPSRSASCSSPRRRRTSRPSSPSARGSRRRR